MVIDNYSQVILLTKIIQHYLFNMLSRESIKHGKSVIQLPHDIDMSLFILNTDRTLKMSIGLRFVIL